MRSSTCRNDSIVHFGRKLTFYRVIGERLRLARDRAGMSQTTLARACGLSQGVIDKAEQGIACTLYVAALIAQNIEGVSLDDLVPMIDDKVAP